MADLKKIMSDNLSQVLNSKFESFYQEISNYMLAEFKIILESLYSGDIEKVNQILGKISENADVKLVESQIFQEIGKLARDLHNDIKTFINEVQPELEVLSDGEVSQATKRLQDVIKLTEKSANTTLDISEELLNINEYQKEDISELKKLLEFLPEEHKSKGFEHLNIIEENMEYQNSKFMQIMTEQEFQDKVGQTIKKVIALVENVENRLVSFVSRFGETFKHIEGKRNSDDIAKPSEIKLQDAFSDKKETVGQDNVDDLLAQFGF